MRLSRWLFVGFGAVIGVLVVVALALDAVDGGLLLERGENAPPRPAWAGEWEPVARLQDTRGNVQDMVVSSHGLYILLTQEWYRVAGGAVSGPFGSSVPGSPGWLRGGQSIAVGDSGVQVLDSGLRSISRWDLEGHYQDRVEVRAPQAAQVQWLQQLVAGPGSSGYVVAHLREVDGQTRWAVMRLAEADESLDVVLELPVRDVQGGMYELPSAHLRDDGSLLLATTLEYKLIGLSAEGHLLFERHRDRFPRTPVPDSMRRAHARSIGGAAVMSTRAMQMPKFFPPVRSVYWRMDGRIMVLISQGGDSFHVELLDEDGTPLGRLWEQPDQGAFFLASDAVYRVRDEPDAIVIERQLLSLPDVDHTH